MAAGNWANEDELELVNEDGFVYKRRKKFHLNPTAAPKLKDPAVEEKNRLQRKKKVLMKIKERYQNEINQWELLSTTLSEMQQSQPTPYQERDTLSFNPPVMSSDPTCQPLVDQLLTQVEAQEAVIGNISKLCDVVEAVWTAQEEKMKQSVLDLPIWAHTPVELISSLCSD
ncbi:uncharacterized protein LOC107009300 [Solanum pennellii]|uniref:Uncharacterized protein LOC107009300 n=1 Tax=Solanum pennellii TaxID=28526 RepID=A0ABM1G081_SOLPN|nr:uncharacterized protein LOC107009300 [Solanum pennellii]